MVFWSVIICPDVVLSIFGAKIFSHDDNTKTKEQKTIINIKSFLCTTKLLIAEVCFKYAPCGICARRFEINPVMN